MNENIVLKPTYLDKFTCQGHSCKYKCYLYNEVFLSKEEYLAYKNIEIEGIEFREIIGVLGKKRTDDRYAKIRIRKNVDIQLKDYLNIINLELGYDYLPKEYKYSPIYFNIINGVYEEIGNLACPEIAKLALLSKSGIELVNEKITDYNKSIVHKDIITVGSENPIMKYFWDIRVNSLNILMDSSYNLKEKILLLNIFYEHLDILNTFDNVDLVPDKMEELLKFFSTKNYKILFKRLPENEYFNLEIIEMLLNIDLKEAIDSIYKDEMEKSLNGFFPRVDLVDLRTIYLENKKIYDEWFYENEYILENYLINEFLRMIIPYSESSIKLSLNNLIYDYIILRNILIANTIYTGRLDEELLIDKLSSYVRFKIENPKIVEEIKKYMIDNNIHLTEKLSLIL